MNLPNILFPVFMFPFIFHCRSFSSCWPGRSLLGASISHFLTAALNFHVFLPIWNSSPLFSMTRSGFFSVKK